jgi:hypothetical protein
MAGLETIISVMAAEAMAVWPSLDRPAAWNFATGLLAGYRLGDPGAALGMLDCGDEDWRQLVRDAFALGNEDFVPADALAAIGVHG